MAGGFAEFVPEVKAAGELRFSLTIGGDAGEPHFRRLALAGRPSGARQADQTSQSLRCETIGVGVRARAGASNLHLTMPLCRGLLSSAGPRFQPVAFGQPAEIGCLLRGPSVVAPQFAGHSPREIRRGLRTGGGIQ